MTQPQKETAATAISPYLFFGGRCEQALEFYKKTLDAKVDMMTRFNESPNPPPPGTLQAGFENKVMHASFRIRGTTLMASDGSGEAEGGFHGFALTLSVQDDADARRVFDPLADGGNVQMPLSKTFWSPCFGMVTDRFGIQWMIMVPSGKP